MQPIQARFGDTISILVMVLSLMILVAAGVGLIMISLELANVVFPLISVWWGKLLSFLTALMIVFGLVFGVGKSLLAAKSPAD